MSEDDERPLLPEEKQLAYNIFAEWAAKQDRHTAPSVYVEVYLSICDYLRRHQVRTQWF